MRCGRRGRSDAKRAKRKEEKTKGRIVKNGKGPFRVIGGNVTQENEIPWQVAMLRKTDGWHGCGAALLSCDPLIVVTAAHCVE